MTDQDPAAPGALDVPTLAEAMWFEGHGPNDDGPAGPLMIEAAELLIAAYIGIAKSRAALREAVPTPSPDPSPMPSRLSR